MSITAGRKFQSSLSAVFKITPEILNKTFSFLRYFPVSATQEMLDEWRPLLCPFDVTNIKAVHYFEYFLPTDLPPEHHDKGFKWVLSLFSISLCLCVSYFNDMLIVGQLYNKFLIILHNSIMYTCMNFRIFVILICSIQLISFKHVKTCLL